MRYELEITRKCNFKCIGCDRLCNIIDADDSDMSLDDVKEIIAQINQLDNNIEQMTIIGGEPTINPNCYSICSYIKENLLKCQNFQLATNHSNEKLANEIAQLGFNVRHDDGSSNVKDILQRKLSKHLNIMASPKELGLPVVSPSSCWVLNTCGISIHKYKCIVKWYWCGAGTSICKMLEKEHFMKNSLKELLDSDKDAHFQQICQNCIYLSSKKIYTCDSNIVSKCFKNGMLNLNKQ